MLEIGPAIVLALVVATFHSALYVLIRDRLSRHVPLAWLAAIAFALAASALGQRVATTALRIGDFDLLWASVGAWAGIGLVSLLSLLGRPGRP